MATQVAEPPVAAVQERQKLVKGFGMLAERSEGDCTPFLRAGEHALSAVHLFMGVAQDTNQPTYTNQEGLQQRARELGLDVGKNSVVRLLQLLPMEDTDVLPKSSMPLAESERARRDLKNLEVMFNTAANGSDGEARRMYGICAQLVDFAGRCLGEARLSAQQEPDVRVLTRGKGITDLELMVCRIARALPPWR